MSVRLWYPQLDVYDAIRRAGNILNEWRDEELSVERLYILDFFLANPPLLHRTYMPQQIRNEFSKLQIVRPDNGFLSYPAAPILFHKMEAIQKEALQTLIGKGLVDRELISQGRVRPSELGFFVFRRQLAELLTRSERPILNFLLRHFASIGRDSIVDFRRSAGLRRVS